MLTASLASASHYPEMKGVDELAFEQGGARVGLATRPDLYNGVGRPTYLIRPFYFILYFTPSGHLQSCLPLPP